MMLRKNNTSKYLSWCTSLLLFIVFAGCLLPDSQVSKHGPEYSLRLEEEKGRIVAAIENFTSLLQSDKAKALSRVRLNLSTDLRGSWVNSTSFVLNPVGSTDTTEILTINALQLRVESGNAGKATWSYANNSTDSGTWSWILDSSTASGNVYRFNYTGNLNGTVTQAAGSAIQSSSDNLQLTGSYYQLQGGSKVANKDWSFSMNYTRVAEVARITDVLTDNYRPSNVGNHAEFFIRDVQYNQSHKFKIDANGFKFPQDDLHTAIVRTAYIGKPVGSLTAEAVLVPNLFVVDFFLQKEDQGEQWFITELVIISETQVDELPSNKNQLDEGHNRIFRFTGPFNSNWKGLFSGTVSGLTNVNTLNLSIDQTDPGIVGEITSDNPAVLGNQSILNVIGNTNSFECKLTLFDSTGVKYYPSMNLSFDGISTISGTISDLAGTVNATVSLTRQ
ncbi:hypothetical protein ACFL35_07500 [Candidatus Riflebacteria bacterium]